jgi:hypothetical protein
MATPVWNRVNKMERTPACQTAVCHWPAAELGANTPAKTASKEKSASKGSVKAQVGTFSFMSCSHIPEQGAQSYSPI